MRAIPENDTIIRYSMNTEKVGKNLSEFAKANDKRAFVEIFLTLTGLGLFLYGIYVGYTTNNWFLYIPSVLLTAFLLAKFFTIQHDCGHGSLFSRPDLNKWFGRICSLFTTMPFVAWREEHAIHHSHVVDIEKIGLGDVPLLTVSQYKSLSPFRKVIYFLTRNPLFYTTIGPFFYFFLKSKYPGVRDKENIKSVTLTNIFVFILYGSIIWLIGFWTFVFVFIPSAYIGGAIGLTMFYLQHDYQNVHWFTTEEWGRQKASLQGSSFIKLPQPFDWLTHSIGYHHIHHLNSKIPGYRLRECYKNVPEMQTVPPLTPKDVRRAFQLKLWSFEKNRLVTFKEAENLSK